MFNCRGIVALLIPSRPSSCSRFIPSTRFITLPSSSNTSIPRARSSSTPGELVDSRERTSITVKITVTGPPGVPNFFMASLYAAEMTSISGGSALLFLADHADWLVPRVEYPLGLLISKPARLELLSHEEWILWNVDRYRRFTYSG